jgi:hypothetical protein
VPRFFNTAGPNKPDMHFTLPVLARLPQVRELTAEGKYVALLTLRAITVIRA